MNNDKALDVVAQPKWAASVPVRDGEQKVGVRKCRVRDLRLISDAMSTLADELGLTSSGEMAVNLDSASAILKLITKCADEVYKVCSELSALSVEEFEALDLDDGISVAMKIYEVNKDFFLKQVKPLLGPIVNLFEIVQPPISSGSADSQMPNEKVKNTLTK